MRTRGRGGTPTAPRTALPKAPRAARKPVENTLAGSSMQIVTDAAFMKEMAGKDPNEMSDDEKTAYISGMRKVRETAKNTHARLKKRKADANAKSRPERQAAVE